MGIEFPLHTSDRVMAEVKDAGGKDGVGFPFPEHLGHMVDVSGTATRNDRDADGFADSSRELEIISFLGAIRVHAGEQDLSSTAPRNLNRPINGLPLGRATPSVGMHNPATVPITTRINGHDNAL